MTRATVELETRPVADPTLPTTDAHPVIVVRWSSDSTGAVRFEVAANRTFGTLDGTVRALGSILHTVSLVMGAGTVIDVQVTPEAMAAGLAELLDDEGGAL